MSDITPTHCKDFGFEGKNVPLPDPLPKGKICALMGFAQTAVQKITVQVLDGDHRVVAQISKEGTETKPTIMVSDGATPYHFIVSHDHHYVKVFSSDESKIPRVLLEHAALTHGDTYYAGSYLIAVEDDPNGDCDFNDCIAYLTWTLKDG